MYSIHTVLLLFVMVVNILILVVTVGTALICVGRFGAWIWRMIASPPVPPWKRYHIGLNHVSTKVSRTHQNNLTSHIALTNTM